LIQELEESDYSELHIPLTFCEFSVRRKNLVNHGKLLFDGALRHGFPETIGNMQKEKEVKK
jgi:hypothetical protein